MTNQVTPKLTPNLKTTSDAQFIRLAGYFEQFLDIGRRKMWHLFLPKRSSKTSLPPDEQAVF
jgi:hypothetical protein